MLLRWRCCYVASIVVVYRRGRWGRWGRWGGGVGCNNVMWSALDWELWKPWGCCFLEDVVTLQKTSDALAPSNCFKKPWWTWRWKRCDVHFVHGSPVNYEISSYQQNDQKCLKPQFQWLECCTHVWPSMEDVNLSFFCADKLTSSLSAPTLKLWLIEHFQRKA